MKYTRDVEIRSSKMKGSVCDMAIKNVGRAAGRTNSWTDTRILPGERKGVRRVGTAEICTGAATRRARRRRRTLGDCSIAWYWLRYDDDGGLSERGDDASELCCWVIFSSAGSKEEIVLWEAPLWVCFPHTVGATLLPAHPVGCSVVYRAPGTEDSMP